MREQRLEREQIEALARDIEITTAVSAWRIGESLAKARELHRYKRAAASQHG